MKITIDSPLDMHLHLRDGEMLQLVAPLSAETFAGGLIMPNLVPPITTHNHLQAYRSRILKAIGSASFMPFMTLFFKEEYTEAFLQKVRKDLLAIKLYPAGITTNSDEGVRSWSIKRLAPTLEAMSRLGIPLCVHGETEGFVMDREAEFIPLYEEIASHFPELIIVMEHITTKAAVEALDRFENLYATITLHHLYITLDDVAGALLRPHLFCKPIAKRPEDRQALRHVALRGHKKVMFGSDSAPHPRSAKESPGCAAGVMSAPVALSALAQLFDRYDALDHLQAFVSDNAQRIYKITPPCKRVTLEKRPWEVPSIYGEAVVPIFAGEKLSWSVVDVA